MGRELDYILHQVFFLHLRMRCSKARPLAWATYPLSADYQVSHPAIDWHYESDGRKLPSCLIHGDLWDANIRPDADTGNFWIFDCAVYYGHHEMDLANWGANYHEISDPIYRDTYFEYIKPSEPQNEWKDRNLLYSLIAKLLRSINWPESTPRKMWVQ